MSIMLGRHSNKLQAWQQEEEVTPNCMQREQPGSCTVLLISKAAPSAYFSIKAVSHKPPQTMPPATGDPVFRCLRLWGTVLIQIQSEALKPFASCSGILCGSLISLGFSLGVTAICLGHPGLLLQFGIE